MKRWPTKPLAEICVVDWGNTELTKSAYVEDGRYLAVSAAGCDGRIGHKEHAKHTPVLSAIGAQCGRMFLPEEDFTAIKNTITLTPLEGVCSGKFLYQLLTYVELPKRGAAQPFISKGDIQTFQVPVPPMLEQDRIVKLMDEADELRKLRAQADSRTAALLPALFNEMFGDPKTNSHQLPTFRLDSVGKISTGTTPATAKPEYFGGNIPFVRPAELDGFQPICKAEKYLSEAGVAVGRSVRKGATLVGCIGQVGKTGITGMRVAFNQQINAVEFNSSVDDDYGFVCCTLMSPVFQAHAAQALLPILNKSRFSEIEIPVPPLPMQKVFAEHVAEVRELETAQEASRRRLDDLFQSLLHRAFNGEL